MKSLVDHADIRVAECDLRLEFARGLLYAYTRLNADTKRSLESASFLYALIELLGERGLISTEELDGRKQIVAERLLGQYRKNGNGLVPQDAEYDKYTFRDGVETDCGGLFAYAPITAAQDG